MTETEAVLRLVSSIDELDEKPYIRLLVIPAPPKFNCLHTLVLLLVGVVFGFSLHAILVSME